MTKPNPENCKNCSSKCAYDCAQLQYTIQHRTVPISPMLPPDNHLSSTVVYWRRRVEIVKIFIGILLISITGMDWNG